MAIKITCINKSGGYHENPHEAISNFGWINEQNGQIGRSTRQEMVNFLDINKGQAYVREGGLIAYCYTRQGRNGKFVQTYSDGVPIDNLLKLPECI